MVTSIYGLTAFVLVRVRQLRGSGSRQLNHIGKRVDETQSVKTIGSSDMPTQGGPVYDWITKQPKVIGNTNGCDVLCM